MAVIAQFWTFVSDIYNVEQGAPPAGGDRRRRRAGRPGGARLAKRIYAVVGVGGMFLIAAGVLLLSLGLTALADRRLRGPRLVTASAEVPGAPLPGARAACNCCWATATCS